jgi:hypothetical protein
MYMPDNFLEALGEKEEGEKREGKTPLLVYRGESYSECPVRKRCTRGEARMVSRDGRELLLETMRLPRTKEGKQIYARRGYTVEPVFEEMKWDGRKPSFLRGSVKVGGSRSLASAEKVFRQPVIGIWLSFGN